ncbi:hypothetical protein JCM6882_001418 [Rhodosporidiobolus microsporus]
MPPKRPRSRPPHKDNSPPDAPASVERTWRMLQSFYSEVKPLTEMVSNAKRLLREGDLPVFCELVEGMVVASTAPAGLPTLRALEDDAGSVTMSEIIDQVQQRIFGAHVKVVQREKAAGRPAFMTPKNVLALGYRLTSDRTNHLSQARGQRGPSFTNVFPNTIISSLTSSGAWGILLARLGPDALIELFSDPSIAVFTALPNACYLQVSGVPVADLQLREDAPEEKQVKTRSTRPVHQRAKRKRRRRSGATEGEVEEPDTLAVEEVDEGAAMDADTPPPQPPLPKLQIDTVGPPSLSKTALRPTVSAPLFASSSVRPAFPPLRPTQTSSQLSPTKSGRLPLRATQSSTSFAGGEERPKKRRKLETIHSSNAVVFSRHRMYHNRLARSKGSAFPYGLPVKHVLTRLPTLFPSLSAPPANASLVDQARAEAPARHLAKYVFPRQFGLHNSFTFPKARSFEVLPDYLDRELEIKKLGAVKTPTRLKPALEHLTRLAVLSQRCNYRKMLDRHCRSRMTHKRLEADEKSAVLDLVSEPRTQASRANASFGVSQASLVRPHNQTQANEQVDKKPKLAEYACSFYEVESYVLNVVEQVIPRALWGSTANAKLIKSHVSSFIRLRRFESTSLHALLQGFAILDCAWLAPPSASHASTQQHKPNALDMEKRREVLSDFLFWFFDSFIIDLIRTAFYVTDAATHQNRPLYFRQDDWNALCAPLLESLGSTVFEKVPATQLISMQQKRELGFSFVRLLPKEAGVRPIVNLARRPLRMGLNGQKEVGQPINKILQGVFDVLTFEKKRKPHLVGALVTDHTEMFTKLKAFKTRLLEGGEGKELQATPPLYFVKVDVRACYDTIQQDKLLEIVEDVLSETVYWIQKYSRVTPFGQTAGKQFKRQACTDGDLGLFEELAQNLAQELHHTCLADQVVYNRVMRDKLMQLLREHITTNLVKVGSRLYRQREGIPQGSILSSLLCSLFYGDMERTKLGFTADSQSVLLRYVDDFLLISTKQELATRFLRVMDDGIPEYGCSISAEKRLTNFDVALKEGEVVPPLPQGQDFPWCGLSINTRTLDIQFTAVSQVDKELVDQLTIQRHRRPGKAFLNSMFRAVKVRTHILYSDTSYNSPSTAYTNVYRGMLIVALKFQAYVGEWGVDSRRKTEFLWTAIERIVTFAFATLVNRARSRKARLLRVEFTLKREWVNWLSHYAFHRVLSRRPSAWPSILDKLAKEIKGPEHATARLHLGQVVASEGTRFADRTNAARKARRV